MWVGRGGECGCWKKVEKVVIGGVKGSCECVLCGVVGVGLVGVGECSCWEKLVEVVIGEVEESCECVVMCGCWCGW